MCGQLFDANAGRHFKAADVLFHFVDGVSCTAQLIIDPFAAVGIVRKFLAKQFICVAGCRSDACDGKRIEQTLLPLFIG